MKTIRLLLGSSEAIFNALITTAVQKVCGQRATVRCTTTVRVDEFLAKACAEDFHLVIFIAPDNLLPDPAQPAGRGPLQEALRIVHTIRASRSFPIIVLSSQPEWSRALLGAGVNRFLSLPVNPADLEEAMAECLSPSLAGCC